MLEVVMTRACLCLRRRRAARTRRALPPGRRRRRPRSRSPGSRSRSRSSAIGGASITSTRRTRPTCSSRRATRPRGIGCSSSRSGGGRRPARWRRSSGRRELKRDRGARLHLFRGDLDDELERYHPRGKSIVEAYVRGVNAYIAETERNPALLPMEFRMLGIKPGRWTPAVVISRHQALTSNRQRGSAAAARASRHRAWTRCAS